MKASGYSVWIMPKSEVYDVLQKAINDLAREYSAPIFNPHITLLGDLEISKEEVVKRVESVASNTRAFQVKFEEIDFQDYYFRSLYLKVKPSDELTRLYEETKRAFQIEGTDVYMPHISLLYGNYPSNIKQKIIQDLKDKFNFDFTASSIHIFHAFGDPDEWVKAKEIHFRK